MTTPAKGKLLMHSKNSKTPKSYTLNLGPKTIGTSLNSNIRIKNTQGCKNEPVFCELLVKPNGLVWLENLSKVSPPILNGSRVKHRALLNNGDKFEVSGKIFQYVNSEIKVPALINLEKKSLLPKKRMSVMPDFKMKPSKRSASAPKIPVKQTPMRRSASVTSTKCFEPSTLPKVRKSEWNTVSTPQIVVSKQQKCWTTAKPVLVAEKTPRTSLRRSLFSKKFEMSNAWESSPESSNGSPTKKTPQTNKTSLTPARRSTRNFSFKKVELSPASQAPATSEETPESIRKSTRRSKVSLVTKEIAELSSPVNNRGAKRPRESTNTVRVTKKQKTVGASSGIDVIAVNFESSEEESFEDEEEEFYESLQYGEAAPSVQNNITINFTSNVNISQINNESPPDMIQFESPITNNQNSSWTSTTSDMFKTPQDLVKTPSKRTPKTLKSSQNNDFSDVEGVEMLRSTTNPKSPEKSPENDLKNVRNSPKNDLTNQCSDSGGEEEFEESITPTPESLEKSENDLKNFSGMRKFASTPKLRNSPKNNLTIQLNDSKDEEMLMESARKSKTPAKTPKKDLKNVSGLGRLSKTPNIVKSPKNDSSNQLNDPEDKGMLLESAHKSQSSAKSPKMGLRNVSGLRKLSSVLDVSNSTKNDSTSDYEDEEILMESTRQSKSPEKSEIELKNVSGFRKLSNTPKVGNSPKNDSRNQLSDSEDEGMLIDSSRKSKTPAKTPKKDLKNVSGLRKLSKTPKVDNSPKNESLNQLSDSDDEGMMIDSTRKSKTPAKSPKKDLKNVSGLRKLSKTPKVDNSPKNESINELSDSEDEGMLMESIRKSKSPAKSPEKDLKNVSGHRKLSKTPKVDNSPKNESINQLSDSEDEGMLMESIRKSKTPANSPEKDLKNVPGFRKLSKTPKVGSSPKNDSGNQLSYSKDEGMLMKSTHKTKLVAKSPKNDLRIVAGVKKLFSTPKELKSPENDLRNVRGVKKLLATPRLPSKSPKNDLSNVAGVKRLMKTPKVVKSPKNDLSNIVGVRNLLKTPKAPKSPKNDLTNVSGVKKILKTPKVLKSPKNDLSNIIGVKKLLQTPKFQRDPLNDLSNVDNIHVLFESPARKPSLSDLVIEEPKSATRGKKNKLEVLKLEVLKAPTPIRTSARKRTQRMELQPDSSPEITTRSTRGRRKMLKEMNNEHDKENEKIKTPAPSPAPTRGRKKVAKEVEDNVEDLGSVITPAPSPAPKRGRKRAEQVEIDETQDEEIIKVASSPAPKRGKKKVSKEVKDNVEDAPSPAKKGGRKRAEQVEVDENQDEEIVKVAPSPAPKRGKKKTVKEAGDNEDIIPAPLKRGRKKISQEVGDNGDNNVTAAPSPVPKRGRKKTVLEKDESEAPRTRRGGTKIIAILPKEELMEETEETVVVEELKPRRGGRKKAVVFENSEVPEEEPTKPKRGRKNVPVEESLKTERKPRKGRTKLLKSVDSLPPLEDSVVQKEVTIKDEENPKRVKKAPQKYAELQILDVVRTTRSRARKNANP